MYRFSCKTDRESLQIILVDDGATDNSPQICDEWAKKDSTKFERSKKLRNKLMEYSSNYTEISDVRERIDYSFVGYMRMSIQEEIEFMQENRFKQIYQKVKEMCCDDTIQKVYECFPKNLLERKGVVYLDWVLHKRIWLLILYYSM